MRRQLRGSRGASRGASLWAWVGGIVVVILLTMFVRFLLRSDAQRLSDAVDDARDALVESNDEEFLAFFSPDVNYQERGTFEGLKKDLASWHSMGISEVYVIDREIDMDGEAATIELVVVVGPQLVQIARVDVTLEAEKDEEGNWRVSAFSWEKP